jgi:hypothetical protein
MTAESIKGSTRITRKALPKMEELKEGDCRASHFYETVGQLDFEERTPAESALVIAYLEWATDDMKGGLYEVLSLLWRWIKYIFIAASAVLWLLLIASLNGLL